MRTTLNLPDELLVAAKQAAARQRTTVTALIESGLRRELQRRAQPASASIRLPVFNGKPGLATDVDLTSNAAMLDVCDEQAGDAGS